jgi:hypothetical protein
MALRLPTVSAKGLLDVTPELLHKLKVKAILLDVDNTLSHHDSQVPFDGAVAWAAQMEQAGFRLIIVSNNSQERVAPFAAQFHLPFIWKAHKPLPVGYKKAAQQLGVKFRESVIVGDQVYTDVIGANVLGMKSILLEPAEPEDGFSFRVRRHFEVSVRKKAKEKGLYWEKQKGDSTV